MKRRISLLLSLTFLFFWGTVSAGAKPDMKPVIGSEALETFKKLEGHWKGAVNMNGENHPATLAYKATSNGSAIVETMGPDTPMEMISVYHDTKGKLSMTHYCGIGNQPVMDLKKAKNGVYEFKFSKKRNTLNHKTESHMHGLTVTLIDDDTLEQAWDFYEDGKKSFTSIGKFKRE